MQIKNYPSMTIYDGSLFISSPEHQFCSLCKILKMPEISKYPKEQSFTKINFRNSVFGSFSKYPKSEIFQRS